MEHPASIPAVHADTRTDTTHPASTPRAQHDAAGVAPGIPVRLVTGTPARIACARCALVPWCHPAPGKFPHNTRVAKGELLYRAGDPFVSLFAVHVGFFKLCTSSVVAEQVVGFQMAGELLGADGLARGIHSCDAIALEDSVVCVVPYERIEQKTMSARPLQREFHRLLGAEIDRRQQVAALLTGGHTAEMRIAAFVDDLALRHRSLGFSGSKINLRMSRRDIGLYLGLTQETVSRSFTRLDASGVLRVSHRAVEILDAVALRKLATELPGEPSAA